MNPCTCKERTFTYHYLIPTESCSGQHCIAITIPLTNHWFTQDGSKSSSLALSYYYLTCKITAGPKYCFDFRTVLLLLCVCVCVTVCMSLKCRLNQANVYITLQKDPPIHTHTKPNVDHYKLQPRIFHARQKSKSADCSPVLFQQFCKANLKLP